MSKTILVTGGCGFIGSNFIRYWLKKYPEDRIVNLDKLTYAGNLENLKDVEDNKNYKFFKGDICDGKLVDEIIRKENVDTIVHFAAESHVDRSILDPSPFIRTNIIGTYTLLECALKNKEKIKRFHHVSTDEVFGSLELNSKEKFNEKTPYNPRSPYSASKASADHLVRAYYYTYNLPITISNCSNNFGYYHFPEKLIPLAITNILDGKKVPIYGDGLHVRDWLFVEDHCTAIDLILHKGKIGETYFIGGTTEGISNLDVVKKILKIMNKDESWIKFVKDRPGHDRKYVVDWSKINKELGWRPKYDFDEALKLTVEWYIKNQDWWRKIKARESEYYKKQYGEI